MAESNQSSDKEFKADLPKSKLDQAGTSCTIKLVPTYEDGREAENTQLNDKSLRVFQVSAKLSTSLNYSDSINGAFDQNSSSTFIKAPQEAASLEIACKGEKLLIRKNADGFLSMIEFLCNETSIESANLKFRQTAFPIIDNLSYLTNTPIIFELIRIVDEKHAIISLTFTPPYEEMNITGGELKIFSIMEPIYAMYREAKNTSSNIYRIFCYFKILEALFGKFKSRLNRDEAKLKIKLTKKKTYVKDLIEGVENIPESCKQYANLTTKDFFDKELAGKFRNSIAHFVDRDDSILNVSSPSEIDKFNQFLHITDLCVRNEIRAFEELQAEYEQKLFELKKSQS